MLQNNMLASFAKTLDIACA